MLRSLFCNSQFFFLWAFFNVHIFRLMNNVLKLLEWNALKVLNRITPEKYAVRCGLKIATGKNMFILFVKKIVV